MARTLQHYTLSAAASALVVLVTQPALFYPVYRSVRIKEQRRNQHKILCNLYPQHTLTYSDTAVSDIEDAFKSFTGRKDVAIILINQNVSYRIHDPNNVQSQWRIHEIGKGGFQRPRTITRSWLKGNC